MLADRPTLGRFLVEERRRNPEACPDLNALVLDVALACKAIARRVARGGLGDGAAPARPEGADSPGGLESLAQTIFLRSNEWGGLLAGMVSEGMAGPVRIPEEHPKGSYLLVFDPLDGASNAELNVPVGSLFSILESPRAGDDAATDDFLQPGTRQVCAGYAIYGPATMLVITVGRGVHAFTLDPELGEFVLTHPDMQIPEQTREFAINASHSRFWEPGVKRYVDECLTGSAGTRGKDFTMRWIASLVAELHRILLLGGVYLHPSRADARDRPRAPSLLHEANPVALLVEQAGGAASTGRERVLDVKPEGLHQRSGLIFGSRAEVERIERYHRDHNVREYEAPLFGLRGLFRTNV